MTFEPIAVVYDGDCAFCTRSLRLSQRLDCRRVMRLYDFHDSKVIASRFPMLAGADFDQAMFAVRSDGAVFRGFFAFKELLKENPPRVAAAAVVLPAGRQPHRAAGLCLGSAQPQAPGLRRDGMRAAVGPARLTMLESSFFPQLSPTTQAFITTAYGALDARPRSCRRCPRRADSS